MAVGQRRHTVDQTPRPVPTRSAGSTAPVVTTAQGPSRWVSSVDGHRSHAGQAPDQATSVALSAGRRGRVLVPAQATVIGVPDPVLAQDHHRHQGQPQLRGASRQQKQTVRAGWTARPQIEHDARAGRSGSGGGVRRSIRLSAGMASRYCRPWAGTVRGGRGAPRTPIPAFRDAGQEAGDPPSGRWRRNVPVERLTS